MTAGGIVRARMSSSRLPDKALLEAGGRTMLGHVVDRVGRAETIDRVVVATSNAAADDPIAAEAGRLGVPCFRGSADDVLDRIYRCAAEFSMDVSAHFGADNPLIDPAVIDLVIGDFEREPADYVTNNLPPTFPDGLEVEVVGLGALERIWREATQPEQREHALLYVWNNPEQFRIRNITHEPNLHHLRWTLDFPEDWELIRTLFETLPNGFGMNDAIAYLDEHPELRDVNQAHRDNYEWR